MDFVRTLKWLATLLGLGFIIYTLWSNYLVKNPIELMLLGALDWRIAFFQQFYQSQNMLVAFMVILTVLIIFFVWQFTKQQKKQAVTTKND